MASRAVFATLVVVRHLTFIEGVRLSNFPATGFDSEDVVYHSLGFPEAFRRVPSKQGPPNAGSFLNFESSASACAEFAGVSFQPKRKAILLRAVTSAPQASAIPKPGRKTRRGICGEVKKRQLPGPRPNLRIPDVEIIWKSCGILRLTGFRAAQYVCKVSRTVGFVPVSSAAKQAYNK